jgi:uncharacterized OB-fold protein
VEWRTLPTPDIDSAPYWQALAEGRFMLQRCSDCGAWTWPARPICSGCHGSNLAWVQSPGTGTVYSWVITHQPYGPDLAQLVPYPVALVRLDEQDDILIPGRYVGDVALCQGLRVRAHGELATENIGLLTWDANA